MQVGRGDPVVRRALLTSVSLLLVTTLVLTTALQVLAQSDGSTQGSPSIIATVASSELAKGPNRFLFGLIDREGTSVAAPDVDVHLRFVNLDADPGSVVFESDASFLWAIEDVRGLYASKVDFTEAGNWGTLFDVTFPDGSVETTPAQYPVHDTSSTPAIGAPAPSIDTPTAADVDGDLSLISTDTEPLPRLYDLSIEDALAEDKPLVIVFATPAFCQSATCGPTLDKIKTVATDLPEVNFVHVEPYVMAKQNGSLQPVLSDDGYLQVAPWTEAYGLVTEPFVIVVAADGTVVAKYEGAISVDEIEATLADL